MAEKKIKIVRQENDGMVTYVAGITASVTHPKELIDDNAEKFIGDKLLYDIRSYVNGVEGYEIVEAEEQ